MARLEFFVVSKSASVDRATNQASVFEILEEIGVPSFPSMLNRCIAFSLWHREPDEQDQDFQLLIQITSTDGSTNEFRSNFHMTKKRHRTLLGIEGIPLPQPGELIFEVLLNGKHAATHVVDVYEATPVDAVDS